MFSSYVAVKQFDFAKFIQVYPCYIDSTLTLDEGRRMGKEFCCKRSSHPCVCQSMYLPIYSHNQLLIYLNDAFDLWRRRSSKCKRDIWNVPKPQAETCDRGEGGGASTRRYYSYEYILFIIIWIMFLSPFVIALQNVPSPVWTARPRPSGDLQCRWQLHQPWNHKEYETIYDPAYLFLFIILIICILLFLLENDLLKYMGSRIPQLNSRIARMAKQAEEDAVRRLEEEKQLQLQQAVSTGGSSNNKKKKGKKK